MQLPTLEECKPGFRATGFNVIVAMPPTETVRPSGLIIPQNAAERERMCEVRGRVVSVSPAAFDFADFGGAHPTEGSAVIFAKFAGIETKGDDGRDYRILLDRDISAVIEEAA
jgi:co-chaperonin GroES (HSP10)